MKGKKYSEERTNHGAGWRHRLAVILNLVVVFWLCLMVISFQVGEWPG